MFRGCAPPSPSAARCSGAADALWACPRASSRFAAFDCALRFTSCARHSSPSGLRCSQARLQFSSVPTIRNSRLATLPLASLPPLSSAWSLRIVRKLTRGAPCFTGLIGGYCTLNSQWSSCCALRLAVLPCSLGLLRPVSRTARGLRAPHWLRRLFRPHWTSASPVSRTARALRAPPLGKGSLLDSAIP